MAQPAVLPVLFAVDRDPNSLEAMLSDLSGRFGKDFGVTGETSREGRLPRSKRWQMQRSR